MKRALIFILALTLLSLNAAAQDSNLLVRFNAVVPQFGLEEITFRLPADSLNPYNPDEMACEAVVTAPSGAISHIPAFYYGGPDPARPDFPTDRFWKIRFTPVEAGEHEVEITNRVYRGYAASIAKVKFAANQSGGGGFVRAASGHLKSANGKDIFLFGANICWAQENEEDIYFRKMDMAAAQGVTALRIWLAPWWIQIEPRVGRYDENACARLDRIISHAESLGIRLILCIEQHGNFQQPGFQVGMWPKNPYNRDDGGPCASVADFFTDETAKRLFRNRLRYIIARWGYSPNIVSWELFNEVEWIQFPDHQDENYANVEVWHRDMADFIRKNDPYAHLISTSSDIPFQKRLAQAGAIDLIQIHLYDPVDVPARLWDVLPMCRETGLPVIIGEYAEDPKKGQPWIVRRGIMVAALGGACGAFPWLQDVPELEPCLHAVSEARADFQRLPSNPESVRLLWGQSNDGANAFGFQYDSAKGAGAVLYVYQHQKKDKDTILFRVKGLDPGGFNPAQMNIKGPAFHAAPSEKDPHVSEIELPRYKEDALMSLVRVKETLP